MRSWYEFSRMYTKKEDIYALHWDLILIKNFRGGVPDPFEWLHVISKISPLLQSQPTIQIPPLEVSSVFFDNIRSKSPFYAVPSF